MIETAPTERKPPRLARRAPSSPRHLWNQKVPMRDGVNLSVDIFLPAAGIEGGPYPTILYRTPYHSQVQMYIGHAAFFAEHGYATVVQDVRGRHDSDGKFYPFFNEGPDGYDTVEWVAEQSWCNGKVGMNGVSYDGWAVWAAARERPPHLATFISNCPGAKFMEELPYRNGLIHMFMFWWLNFTGGRVEQDQALIDWERVVTTLPLRKLDEEMGRSGTAWQDWLDHPTLDEFWKPYRFTPEHFAGIDMPVLHVTGWRDGDQSSTLHLYEGMRAHSPARDLQYLQFGPWPHGAHWTGPLMLALPELVGTRSLRELAEVDLAWFDRWLRGDESAYPSRPRVSYYVTELKEWRQAEDWPPPETVQKTLHLTSAGDARTLLGDGRLLDEAPENSGSDAYLYDPLKPARGLVGMEVFKPGSGESSGAGSGFDRRYGELREDFVVYTSDPLAEPLLVAGAPSITFHASSDCRDTDWIVYLTDVKPDGASQHLTEALIRARFRESLERETLLEPGTVYRYDLDFTSIAHRFAAGHRIRISVTSSNFPLYDRNLNTGNPIGSDTEADARVATNSIHHGPECSSLLRLPVLKG